MPEALAIVAVFAVAVAACVGAWLHSRDPANFNAQVELARLQEQQHLLQERLQLGQQEEWSDDMLASVSAQLDLTRVEIEHASEQLRSQSATATRSV